MEQEGPPGRSCTGDGRGGARAPKRRPGTGTGVPASAAAPGILPRRECPALQWFTIGPAGLERIRANTRKIRDTIGTRDIAQRVRGLDEAALGVFLNDVLSLVDEAEGILGRVRNETPSRSLPRPFEKPEKP